MLEKLYFNKKSDSTAHSADQKTVQRDMPVNYVSAVNKNSIRNIK